MVHRVEVFAADGLSGSITISGAWAIYPTVVAWAEAFQKKYPGVRIDVSAGGAGKGAADTIVGLADIGMVSRDPDPAELQKGIRAVYILKDAVFPVISEKNFYLQEFLEKGIKRQALADIYVAGTATRWGQIIVPTIWPQRQIVGTKADKPVHVYTRADSSGAAASWAAYFGKKQEDLRGVGVYGDPGLLDAVKRDPAGIGYGNFGFIFTREGSVLPGLKVVAIDMNENGKADPDEICETRSQAVAAIAAGRYPATRKNYFFVRKNAAPLVGEFIRFVLSEEGARIVDEVGASLPLLPAEREKILEELP
ncbi:MAG: substrate-binding domain-containing protein [Candidatus Omnitrophica bacterium]|nr:substrate-binding domain-containing protein [Candidatus Omnitrophota bacterium]